MADGNGAVAQPTTVGDLQRKMKVTGTVKRTELYGAFIDLGVGTDAILHVSQLGDRGTRVADAMKPGDSIDVWVDKVKVDENQVMVTLIEPLGVEWRDLAPEKAFTGKVTRLENFGAFVSIGAEKDGLVHISEISHEYIKHPSQALGVGDEVEVQVLSFSKRKRRINLSIKNLLDKPEAVVAQEEFARGEVFEEEPQEEVPTAMEFALRRAMNDDEEDDNEDYHPSRRRMPKNKKQKRRRRQRERDDIIARTLEISNS